MFTSESNEGKKMFAARELDMPVATTCGACCETLSHVNLLPESSCNIRVDILVLNALLYVKGGLF